MKITKTDNGTVIEEAYSGIILKANGGDTIGICQRDNGFELQYNGEWYEAKNGTINKLRKKEETTIEDDIERMDYISPEVLHTPFNI